MGSIKSTNFRQIIDTSQQMGFPVCACSKRCTSASERLPGRSLVVICCAILLLTPIKAVCKASRTPHLFSVKVASLQEMEANKLSILLAASRIPVIDAPDSKQNRTQVADISAYVHPEDYLKAGQSKEAFSNNELDASPAINTALATGKSVILPCGYYQVNEMLQLTRYGQSLSGASRSCTTLALNIKSGPAIKYSSINQSIHDLELDFTQKNVGGSAIYSEHSSGSHLYNLVIQGAAYNGIYIVSSGGVEIDNVNFLPPRLDGELIPDPQKGPAYAGGAAITLVNDVNTGKPTLDTFLNEINISQYKYGLMITDASGVYSGSGLNIVGCKHAIVLAPGDAQTVNGVQFSNVLGDTSFDDNWYLTGGGLINEVMCVNCWASSSVSGAGLSADNTNPESGQISFTNSTFLNNFSQGIKLNGMKNWNLTNITVEMNSREGAGKYPDISIMENTGDYIRIQNSFIGKGGRISALGGNTNTTYAVESSKYSLDKHLMLTGNQTAGHILGMFKLPLSRKNVINELNQGN